MWIEGGAVMITYIPLWKTLVEKRMKKLDLQHAIGCSSATITAMSKDKRVSLDVIDRICKALDCRVEDVIEYVPDP